MRIQETDRILKESRNARHSTAQEHEPGVIARMWQKVTGMFRKH
jgi:hypothetical protein